MRTITRMASLLLILAAGFSWVACGDEPPAPAGGGETPEEPGGGNEEPEDTLSEQEKEFLQIEFQSPTEADADNGFARYEKKSKRKTDAPAFKDNGKKDDWKQFFNHNNTQLKGEEPDFSEEGWARRRPKKK